MRALRIRGPLALALVCSLVLAAVAAAAKAPKPVKGATYTGMTSEQIPVTFKISKSGGQLTSFATRLAYNGHCGQGGGPSLEVAVRTMGIGAGGKFSATVTAALKGVPAVKPAKVKVSGRISGRSASGSVVEPGNRCSAPHAGVLPYSETFTVRAG